MFVAPSQPHRAPEQAEQDFFQKREFCFTLDNDIFCRYQSFRNAEEMQRALCETARARTLSPCSPLSPAPMPHPLKVF